MEDKLKLAFITAYNAGYHQIADLIWESRSDQSVAQSQSTVPSITRVAEYKRRLKPVAAHTAKPPQETIKRGSPGKDKMLSVLRQFGPLTTAEAGSHYQPENKNGKQAAASAYAILNDLRKLGLAEKRECPDTRLDKWWPIPRGGNISNVGSGNVGSSMVNGRA